MLLWWGFMALPVKMHCLSLLVKTLTSYNQTGHIELYDDERFMLGWDLMVPMVSI